MRNRDAVARRARNKAKPVRSVSAAASRRKAQLAGAGPEVFKALFERVHHVDAKILRRSQRVVRGLLADKPDLLEALGLEVPRRPGRPKGKRSIPFKVSATVAVAIDYVGMGKAKVIRALGREANTSNIKWINRRLEYGQTAPKWWLESVLLRHLRGRPKDEKAEIMLARLAHYRKK